MKHFILYITDYAHERDLKRAKQEVIMKCPDVKNLKAYQIKYGELDDPIYEGYVEFDAPESYTKIFKYFI